MSPKAPLVLGHPDQHDAVTHWGSVMHLVAFADDLWALADVKPGLVSMVRAAHFKHVSASFHTPGSPSNPTPGIYTLRHVGMLGAMPPAVKGLAPLEFAEMTSDYAQRLPQFDADSADPFVSAFAETAVIPGISFSERIRIAERARDFILPVTGESSMSNATEVKYPEIYSDVAVHVAEVLAADGMEGPRSRKLGKAVAEWMRSHFAGQLVYFAQGHHFEVSKKHEEIYAKFNGTNHSELVREFRISLKQVYKVITTMRSRKAAEAKAAE